MHLTSLFLDLIEWLTSKNPGELLPAKALDVLTGCLSITHRGQESLFLEVSPFDLAERTTKGVLCVCVCVLLLLAFLFFVLKRTCHNPICVLKKNTPLEAVPRE